MENEDASYVFDVSGVSLAKAFSARAVDMFLEKEAKEKR
jgi:hypothetical protein